MANKNVTVNKKLKVIGGSLNRVLQDDGSILTTETVNVRADDGTCEMQLIIKGDFVGQFDPGAKVALALTLVSD